MQNTINTSPRQPITLLGRIGADPSRFITVRDWWRENEPADLLVNPEGTFRSEERSLLKLCEENGITYRSATDACAAGFPVWLFLTISI
ncbi:hypothetical protein [Tardiphaga sp. 839_C3_N1_4]|uniref:hypothetical protein n=1 Tax=Tardiphaga sp. 839_C3_N1_4 TaxID=3240761 RepID=UPI003F202507